MPISESINQLKEQKYVSSIMELAEGIYEHRVLNNQFFDLWMKQKLELWQVETFARNYYERVSYSTEMIALTFLSTRNLDARLELVTNLFSEFGYGRQEKIHILQAEKFLDKLLSKLKGNSFFYRSRDSIKWNLLPTTERLLKGQREFFGNSRPQIALGASLANEWHAYSLLVRLYEGSRHYIDAFETIDEFHESCEYFYVHIGNDEKDHKIQSVKTAVELCKSDEDLELIKQGYYGLLELHADFWEGIYDAISPQNAPNRQMINA